jgi:hypothetical protein
MRERWIKRSQVLRLTTPNMAYDCPPSDATESDILHAGCLEKQWSGQLTPLAS